MSPLNGNNVIRLGMNSRPALSELVDLTKEIQAGLGQPSVSPGFLIMVEDYLNKIDSLFPKPATRDPATDEFLWKEGDADRGFIVYKTLGAICEHPDLGGYECGKEEIIGVKALRLMVTLMLCVPELDDKLKKSNESA
ncbi:hypothetical protein JW752_04545 [Candidatus Peregrinibacteria bacterium]|nr:hypothetical protein [Candidatus Peregrinibacteria bacterium]